MSFIDVLSTCFERSSGRGLLGREVTVQYILKDVGIAATDCIGAQHREVGDARARVPSRDDEIASIAQHASC